MMLDENIRPVPSTYSAGLLILVFFFSTVTFAKPPVPPSPQEQIKVAGHLDLPGMQVRNMFLQQRGDKSYLYLRRADKNAFAIVDVTDPSKPVLIERRALQEPAGGSVDLPAPGSAFGISFVPDGSSGSASASSAPLPTETIQLLDFSDPKHPKPVKTIKGVTSVANDDGRKLVFIVNNEGLWVVSHHRDRPMPMCTTADAEKAEPDCY